MKKAALITYLLLFVFTVFASSPIRKLTRREYINKYQKLAILKMYEYGIPASITMAQGCLESSNGNSMLARKGNNHFGIKCKSSWKGKRIYYDDDKKNECFRKYRSAEDSYADHSRFLLEHSRYAFLFDLDITDYKGWARGLKKAGYATNRHYATRLIQIIEDNKLYLLDADTKLADAPRRQPMVDRPERATIKISSPTIVSNNSSQAGNNRTSVDSRRHSVKRINDLRTVTVKAGDSFESIAREFGLKYWEIYHYNDYKKGRRPRANEILYIEPKYNKANKKNEFYYAKKGDTMHFVAQCYGVKLKRLLKKNRMKNDTTLSEGQKIYLRKNKPKKA